MRPTRVLLLVVAAAVGACAGDAESDGAAARTDATTRGLLASTPEAETDAPPSGIARARQEIDVDTLGFDRGSEDAPVRVVEMSDYGCGYCRQFHQETFPHLNAEFIDAGKVEWKFLPFDNGMFKNSPHALRASECSLEQGPELFEALNERLWEDQAAWKGSDDASSLLSGWARESGVDVARYTSCIAEDRRNDRIAAATALARQVGVRGTPTFFVIGYPPLQGALPTETFRQVLSMVYAEATKERDGS
jgi:protein-disulfide isomerase